MVARCTVTSSHPGPYGKLHARWGANTPTADHQAQDTAQPDDLDTVDEQRTGPWTSAPQITHAHSRTLTHTRTHAETPLAKHRTKRPQDPAQRTATATWPDPRMPTSTGIELAAPP